MGKMSKNKGARYEREIAAWFKKYFECEAYRSQQFSGANNDADVAIDLPIHIECKRVEAFNLYAAIAQAKADAKSGTVPVVVHRRNNKPSVLIVELEDLHKLLLAFKDKLKPQMLESKTE